jgi:hypothetical protein
LPYLPGVFDSILNLLVHSKPFVQDRALAALSSLASSAEDNFDSYYVRVMPLLLDVLEREYTGEEDQAVHDLKGRAVECAGRIGEFPFPSACRGSSLGQKLEYELTVVSAFSRGRGSFRLCSRCPSPSEGRLCRARYAPHIETSGTLLVRGTEPSSVSLDTAEDDDDTLVHHCIDAVAHISKAMGADSFAPYLDRAVNDLLRIAGRDLQPMNVEDDDDEIDGEQDVLFTVGDELCRVDASGLESKATALSMLVVIANVAGRHFLPYVERVLSIALPLLTFDFNDDVQEAAAALIPVLVKGEPLESSLLSRC